MSDQTPVPFNEEHRLAALRSFAVLDTEAEPEFDAITRLVARHFNVAVALVSLVDRDRQWFKAKAGLDACETSREIAFCAHAIMEPRTMVVLDATKDPRFAGNPLVTGEPGIRFYAGAPLITEAGFKLGTLCLIDMAPRSSFSDDEEQDLREFAALVMTGLQARRDRLRRDQIAEDSENPLSAIEDVVAHLAHEIRAPLSAIVGFADLIGLKALGPNCSDAYQEQGRRIAEVGRYLCEMAQRTLEGAQLKSGEVALQETWISLADLEDQIRMIFPQSMDLGDRSLLWTLGAEPRCLQADGVHLQQMLINLLGNAVKYTESRGRIEIFARLTPDGGLDLTVADNGQGMDQDEVALALLPFGRVASATKSRDDSFGLGLPLTKRLIELHGGRLLVESGKNRGTAVTLRFPHYRVAPAGEQVVPKVSGATG